MKLKNIAIGVAIVAAIAGCATVSGLTDNLRADANLPAEAVNRLYAASRADLIAGYQKGTNPIAADYPDWKATATAPAAPGVHSGRYMMTYVNEIGHADYIKYSSQNPAMPIGTLIAKESFTVKREGEFRPGPLFTMEKVSLEDAPDTGGWLYGRVNTDGSKMRTSQKFCHSCHEAFSTQDSLGYPVKQVRLDYVAPVAGAPVAAVATGDAAKGKDVFATCASCHEVGPGAANAFGPVLNDIIGREAGAYAGYSYSAGLKAAREKGLVWDEQRLFEWLEDPSQFVKTYNGDDSLSSKMPIGFADETTRNDVIAYLATLSGEN